MERICASSIEMKLTNFHLSKECSTFPVPFIGKTFPHILETEVKKVAFSGRKLSGAKQWKMKSTENWEIFSFPLLSIANVPRGNQMSNKILVIYLIKLYYYQTVIQTI